MIERHGFELLIFSMIAWEGLWPEGSLNFRSVPFERPRSFPKSIQFFKLRWLSSLRHTVHCISGCSSQREAKRVLSEEKKERGNTRYKKLQRESIAIIRAELRLYLKQGHHHCVSHRLDRDLFLGPRGQVRPVRNRTV